MKPTRFDELRVCGFLDTVPTEGLPRPTVFSQVLRHSKGDAVYLPPFEVRDGLIVGAAQAIGRRLFDTLCERGQATRLEAGSARSDGCFYVRAGSGAAEYTGLSTAVERLGEFAEMRIERGDNAFRSGKLDVALHAYEDAAATIQTPKAYARLLQLGLSERRRSRLQHALESLVGEEGARELVAVARRQLRPEPPIFGSSARRTAEPLRVPA